MESYRTAKVFVPGGSPEFTYVPRNALGLETRLAESATELHKLVSVTGATKSGKTVLVGRVFPRGEAIWVDGGSVREEDDVWAIVLAEADGFTDAAVTEGSTESTSSSISGSLEGNALVAKGNVGTSTSSDSGSSSATTHSRSIPSRAAAVAALRKKGRALVIDDFHYLDRDLQGQLVRALKPLVFDGLPCAVIAIPHRRYDAVKVEREITGRLEAINVPAWDEQELREIAVAGFPLLNVTVSPSVVARLAREAYGSPHLMQEFCRALAFMHDVKETSPSPLTIDDVPDSLFVQVAEGTGKTVFDRLARGPRQRSDRIQRPMKDGFSADIYEVVLKALGRIGPGLATIEYETLRAAIRDLLSDKVPQANEVTRVLEKMAEIATSDEASTPVIDWEKEDQVLHITDPFFAFYLKWGMKGEADAKAV